MIVLCAECEKKGRKRVMYSTTGYGESHGLCHRHYLETLEREKLIDQHEQDELDLLRQRESDQTFYDVAHETFYSHFKHCQICSGKQSHHDYCKEGQARYLTMMIPQDRLAAHFEETV